MAEMEFWGWKGTIKAKAISASLRAIRKNPAACSIVAIAVGAAAGVMQTIVNMTPKIFAQGEVLGKNETWGVDLRSSTYEAKKEVKHGGTWGDSSREFVRGGSGHYGLSWVVECETHEGIYTIARQATDPVAAHTRV